MPSFMEILADPKFTDNMEFELNGVKLTLGDARAWKANQQAELDKQAGILERASTVVAELYDKSQVQPVAATPEKKVVADPNADLRNDPLFGQVFTEMDRREATFKELLKPVQTADATLKRVVTMYEQDRLENTFDLLPDKPADLTPQKLAQFALERGIKDGSGRLDYRRAYQEFRRPILEQQRIEAAERAGMEKGRLEAKAESSPKPRFQRPVKTEKPKYGSVRDAMAAAADNSGLMAQLNDALAGLGTVQ